MRYSMRKIRLRKNTGRKCLIFLEIMIFKDCKEAVNYTNCLLINARKVVR